MERFDGAKIVTADGGGGHSVAVTAEGAVYTWGCAADYDGNPAGLGHDDLDHKLVPTLVEPRHLLGARVGRCLPLSPLHALALAMGTHGRLGGGAAGAGGAGGGGSSSRGVWRGRSRRRRARGQR